MSQEMLSFQVLLLSWKTRSRWWKSGLLKTGWSDSLYQAEDFDSALCRESTWDVCQLWKQQDIEYHWGAERNMIDCTAGSHTYVQLFAGTYSRVLCWKLFSLLVGMSRWPQPKTGIPTTSSISSKKKKKKKKKKNLGEEEQEEKQQGQFTYLTYFELLQPRLASSFSAQALPGARHLPWGIPGMLCESRCCGTSMNLINRVMAGGRCWLCSCNSSPAAEQQKRGHWACNPSTNA